VVHFQARRPAPRHRRDPDPARRGVPVQQCRQADTPRVGAIHRNHVCGLVATDPALFRTVSPAVLRSVPLIFPVYRLRRVRHTSDERIWR